MRPTGALCTGGYAFLQRAEGQEPNEPPGADSSGGLFMVEYGRFVNRSYLPSFTAACAAAKRAMGTRKGEQLT